MSWSVPHGSGSLSVCSWVIFVGGRISVVLWVVGLDLGMLDSTNEADCVAYTRSRDDAMNWCILSGLGCQCKRREEPEGSEEVA